MKVRLDQLLYDRKLVPSLVAARSLIGAGHVYVDDRIADKAGIQYPLNARIRLKKRIPYVSRGGFKLEKGLIHFHIDPADWTCVDIGASTGGFTDCLLQHNVRKVYAIDVAYGQLSWQIRQNPRVAVLERFNARNISPLDLHGEKIDLAVIDASFISVSTLLHPLLPLFQTKVRILALIKPQFELPKEDISAGGIVTSTALHQKAINKIIHFADDMGLTCEGVISSPILGPKGNQEFLIFITSSDSSPPCQNQK